MSEKVKFEKRESLKEKPDTANLGFGQYFTDYVLIMTLIKDGMI